MAWDILAGQRRLNAMGQSGNAGPMSPMKMTAVNFKDLSLSVEEDLDAGVEVENAEDLLSDEATCSPRMHHRLAQRIGRTKQVIIMVGLPGRGKTFLCNKLKCYLNWLGHRTRHINVGSYRRKLRGPEGETQSADFFDKDNAHGNEVRNRALQEALDDLDAYLATDQGQVVIFDATNSTEERRSRLAQHFHGRYQYLFIESICNDPQVLEENYIFKMRYSPDYVGMDTEVAIQDFKARVKKYEDVYETLTDRNRHYIKLTNMVTGQGYMDVNRISGYIPGKIVFFLMQICKAGMAQSRKIWLTRHGESKFNQAGRIGGDSELSPKGVQYSLVLPDLLIERLPETSEGQAAPVSVWTSTLIRTIQTASHLPFPELRWKALDEIHAGSCDGLTYAQIEERFPDEFEARSQDKLRYRYPAGESYMDVIQRLEPVIIEMERERECVCVVGHQAILRAILGYFQNVPLEKIPTLHVPLHTVIELRPRPDGTMEVEMLPAAHLMETVAEEAAAHEGGHGGASPSVPVAPVPQPKPAPRLPTLTEGQSPGHSPSASFASHSPLESSFLLHRRRESLPAVPDSDKV